MLATGAGVILGTAGYMSPEQAKGLPADHRSDIFSFGILLYEMVTARSPFRGETATDLLASILARDPELGALDPHVHPRLLELVKRCLEKDPKRRWQAIADVRLELEASPPLRGSKRPPVSTTRGARDGSRCSPRQRPRCRSSSGSRPRSSW